MSMNFEGAPTAPLRDAWAPAFSCSRSLFHRRVAGLNNRELKLVTFLSHGRQLKVSFFPIQLVFTSALLFC